VHQREHVSLNLYGVALADQHDGYHKLTRSQKTLWDVILVAQCLQGVCIPPTIGHKHFVRVLK
jgi:hypothetical protein